MLLKLLITDVFKAFLLHLVSLVLAYSFELVLASNCPILQMKLAY